MNLLWALVSRDVRGRYRRALLGPLWAIVQPVVMMVVFTVVRGVIDIPSEGVPYIIFSYSALVPWTFFAGAVGYAGRSALSNGGIIKKMNLDREVFPLAAVCTALFDFAMAGLVLAGMMVWFRVPLGWPLLWLPLLILLTLLLAFGVGMFVASLGTFKADVAMAVSFFMQIWMLASPVAYPLSSVPERWRTLYLLNPMVGIIEGFRNVLVKAQSPPWGPLGVSLMITTLVLAITWPLYRRMSQYFADVL